MSDIGKKVLKFKSLSKKIDLLEEYLNENGDVNLDDLDQITASITEAAKYAQQFAEAAAVLARLPLENMEQMLRICADAQDEAVSSRSAILLICHITGLPDLVSEYWSKWAEEFSETPNFLLQLSHTGKILPEIGDKADIPLAKALEMDPSFKDSIIDQSPDFRKSPYLKFFSEQFYSKQ